LQDSGGTAPLSTTVSFSTTPTFPATSQDQLFLITLTGNVTSSTLVTTGLPVPSLITFELTQDGSGGRTFVFPSNTQGGLAPNTQANSTTVEQFVWDGTTAYYAGALPCTLKTESGAYTLTAADCIIHASASSGAFTLSLPHAVTGTFWEITRTDTSTNLLSIAGDAGQINGTSAIRLQGNATTICHADGINSWCTVPGTEYSQSTTLNGCGATCTFTYPLPYTTIRSCQCTGEGGSCNIASKSTTSCTINTSVGSNDVIVTGIP
jgi:hypothetical protein